jgi:nitrous oxide reductase accessory protein NosL
MKKVGWSLLVMAFFLWSGLLAYGQVQEDIQKSPSCKYCGMDRQQFAHSRVYIEYEDEMPVGMCSIHCAAVDLALNIDKMPKEIRVGDYNSKLLINAEKAFWVIGGIKPGVMTRRAKWAFEKKEEAEKFTKENGGETVTFDQAMKAAYEDMNSDTRMIRERRKMMRQRKMEHKHN